MICPLCEKACMKRQKKSLARKTTRNPLETYQEGRTWNAYQKGSNDGCNAAGIKCTYVPSPPPPPPKVRHSIIRRLSSVPRSIAGAKTIRAAPTPPRTGRLQQARRLSFCFSLKQPRVHHVCFRTHTENTGSVLMVSHVRGVPTLQRFAMSQNQEQNNILRLQSDIVAVAWSSGSGQTGKKTHTCDL